MNNSIVIAVFGSFKKAKTRELYQWDYGISLDFRGLNLPEYFTVHFANQPMSGTAKKQVGQAMGESGHYVVTIPDEYLTTGLPVYAWVYLHDTQTDGETVYMVEIPVKKRPQPTEEPPTPVQQGLIEQAIAALNEAVEQTGEDVATTGANVVAAQAAQQAAEAAQAGAQAAHGQAQGFAQQAATSATQAATSATQAQGFEAGAQAAQGAAQAARDAAQGYAGDAATSATKAEQAATTAGYMQFEIDERGHLIYTRVGYHDTMFSLRDGHLILEVS